VPKRLSLLLASLLACVSFVAVASLSAPVAEASPADDYAGPYFGDGNLPPGCILDKNPNNPANTCYHARVGLNALDSPIIDVAVLVPASPTAERDLRILRQAVEAWEGGISYLSGEMGLDWLRDGVKFNITPSIVGATEGGEVSTYPLYDPEIVVLASNPVGGAGIGIDPADSGATVSDLLGLNLMNEDAVPCHTIENPFSMETWEGMPGYDGHHNDNGGVYVEDCGGAGGNVCFAINGAIDPLPENVDYYSLFDLVAHEFGHCLTLGHVGDGADGDWGVVPTNDPMAYNRDPVDLNKCVSTLDVEGFALRMSRYLDRNGDNAVTNADVLVPNDITGDGLNSYQVQHPADHLYASATGDPRQCPQPDLGLVPGPVTDWTPTPVDTTKPHLSVKSLSVADGRLSVSGAASWAPIASPPTDTTGSTTDPAGDSSAPVSDITGLDVDVTPDVVHAVLQVDEVWPVDGGGSAVAYSLNVDGRRFDSFVPTTSTDGVPITLDNGTGVPMPAGTAVWDKDADTVTFDVPRWYLREQNIVAPYDVDGQTGLHARTNDWLVTEDSAPDAGVLTLAGPPPAAGPHLDVRKATSVTTTTASLQHDGGNTFLPSDSTEGLGLISAVETRHFIPVPLTRQATVTLALTWDDPLSTLALKVEGGSGQQVETGDGSVTVTVPWSRRNMTAIVDPVEILGPVTYELTATMTTVVADADADNVPDVADVCPSAAGPRSAAGCPDTDRDMVQDRFDQCRRTAGVLPDGCPATDGERIVVKVDGARVGMQHIMTKHGWYAYALSAPVTPGTHAVEITWWSGGNVVMRATRSVG